MSSKGLKKLSLADLTPELGVNKGFDGRDSLYGQGSAVVTHVSGKDAGANNVIKFVYKVPPLLWTQIKERLHPAEVQEFKRVLGVVQLRKNKELHTEATALADIYTTYCNESDVSIKEVLRKRAAMPKPMAHSLLLNEIALLVKKLQGVGGDGAGKAGSVATNNTSHQNNITTVTAVKNCSSSSRGEALKSVKSLTHERQEVLWRTLKDAQIQKHELSSRPSTALSFQRPNSADSPNTAFYLRDAARVSPESHRDGVRHHSQHRSGSSVDKPMRMLFESTSLTMQKKGLAISEHGAQNQVLEQDKYDKRKKVNKKKKSKKKRKKATVALSSLEVTTAATAATTAQELQSINFLDQSHRPSSRETFLNSRPSIGAHTPRPSSTVSAPGDIGSPTRSKLLVSSLLALSVSTMKNNSGNQNSKRDGDSGTTGNNMMKFSLDMENESVVALREVLESEEGTLESEIIFLQRALEGEVEHTAEALREAQVQPVTTSELRAVSAELQHQWLTKSQVSKAHGLLASDVRVINRNNEGKQSTGDEQDVSNDTGNFNRNTSNSGNHEQDDSTATTSERPSNFVRRGATLREKLRGKITSARAEARYFS